MGSGGMHVSMKPREQGVGVRRAGGARRCSSPGTQNTARSPTLWRTERWSATMWPRPAVSTCMGAPGAGQTPLDGSECACT